MDETIELNFDVWVGHIIPFLEARDVLALACVNRTFYSFVRALPRHCISTGCVYTSTLENCLNLVEFQAKHPFLQMEINITWSTVSKLFDFASLERAQHNFYQNFDFRLLSSLYGLTLSSCSGITDVSALGSVHTLTLSCCYAITDVSALGTVHTLTLDCCHGITDVSALGSVHMLKIVDCSRVRDVSALGSVHTLKIVYCSRVRDVSALGSVHTLKIVDCSRVRDVSALGSVHTLKLG